MSETNLEFVTRTANECLETFKRECRRINSIGGSDDVLSADDFTRLANANSEAIAARIVLNVINRAAGNMIALNVNLNRELASLLMHSEDPKRAAFVYQALQLLKD